MEVDAEGVWIEPRVIRQRCLETSTNAQTIDESNDHTIQPPGFVKNILNIKSIISLYHLKCSKINFVVKIAKTKRQWQNQTFGSLEICSMSLFVYHVVDSLCLPTRRQIVPGGKFAIIHGFINHLPSNIGLSLALIGNAGKIVPKQLWSFSYVDWN